MVPAYDRAKAGRPARTYIQQLCEDTGCSPEDLPEAMNDREKWRERVRNIRASGTTWWWWNQVWRVYPFKITCRYIFYGLLLLNWFQYEMTQQGLIYLKTNQPYVLPSLRLTLFKQHSRKEKYVTQGRFKSGFLVRKHVSHGAVQKLLCSFCVSLQVCLRRQIVKPPLSLLDEGTGAVRSDKDSLELSWIIYRIPNMNIRWSLAFPLD